MSRLTPTDISSRPASPDQSPALPDLVLKPSRIIRNGKVVWLYSKAG